MDTDLYFVIGVVLLVLAFPSLVGAFAQGRPPRAAAILVMVGGGLLALAVHQKPNAYSFGTAPQVVVRVVADLVG